MNKHSESTSSSMGKKMWVEVCIISARGLPRSSIWKHQWYAVGWIDPNNKYCTKIDASGNPNPVWKTKFSTAVDASEASDFQDLALHIEVYSREPLFLREKLQGTATILLKEFLAKHCSNNSEGSGMNEEDVGSFQLRKKNSDKPQGFIDVSFRISDGKEGTSSYSSLGNEEGFNLKDATYGNTLATDARPVVAHPAGRSESPFHLPANPRPPVNHQYTHPLPYPTNYSNPSVGGPSYPPATGPSYLPAPPRTPPPPPPPSNVGYVPTFLPRANNQPVSYMNVPGGGAGAGRGGGGVGPGFGVGMGAGALAAGAVIFGDDFMSGFELPRGMQDARLTISTDPPF